MTAEIRTSSARREAPFLAALRAGAVLADGATGSLLFELTGRLSERNHVYETLNVANPDLVSQVHRLYLQAGASALKTNTFGANAASLERLGIVGKEDEINRAAVRLARAAIEQVGAAEAGDSPRRFVLGSVGPVYGEESVEAIYGSQLRALIDEGADALLLETFESLECASALVRYAKRFEACPPIALHMSLWQHGSDGSWNIDPAEYVAEAAEAGASVVGVNCLAPWEAEAFVRSARRAAAVESGAVMLSAMPNAGGFERIGHRFMSRVNPEFMGRTARTLYEDGARL
ncbi:MAG: homocysteine S-methyltransferase family protein, partial [Deltaproteobacteria bacterium]|nr:homocysteine S-methyltransferase family protein [Deltaproteobacteria bacterium]